VKKSLLSVCVVSALVAFTDGTHFSLAQSPQPGVITVNRGIVFNGVARGGRVAFAPDALLRQIVLGEWQTPVVGANLTLPDGRTRTATELVAGPDGGFESDALTGGAYLYAPVEAPTDGVYILTAEGNNLVYVNGEPHAGNPYGYTGAGNGPVHPNGMLRIPVHLKRGTNALLFSCSRGHLRAELAPPAAAVVFNPDDATLPDLREKETPDYVGALPILNATEQVQQGLRLRVTLGATTTETRLPTLQPLSVSKPGFRIRGSVVAVGQAQQMQLQIVSARGESLGTPLAVSLRVRRTTETYKKTFVSEIDGSVQYYGVYPAQKPAANNALILTLHGASVEAIGQADAYGAKTWATLAAPTNRRPYGFDWEDWGRLDALEVLANARQSFAHDPTRVMLTGHSMGGHGTWSIGSLFPDHFAVIGPSAGWISFQSYAGATRGSRSADSVVTKATEALERAATTSDTLSYADNLLQEKIYVLHGDADDNVPVTQARTMRAELEKRQHPAVFWHEEKGAGHWWDVDSAPGADCVDWKPMFELFESSRIPLASTVNTINFTTPTPSVSATCYWARIDQQVQALAPSKIRLNWERTAQVLSGTTENVECITIDRAAMGSGQTLSRVTLDGQNITVSKQEKRPLYLQLKAGKWTVVDKAPAPGEKRPERGGPFKMAMNHRFVLVYGTQGTPEENARMLAHARYDAETFLFRGNGSPEVIPDTAYAEQAMRDRGVVVYGNATINRVWQRLLKNAPIQVERGKVTMGGVSRQGDNLACLFVYPKPGSDVAAVAAVGATGVVGLRLTERLPYFTSGVAYPDWVIADPEVLRRGNDAVLEAGYFTNTWQLPTTKTP
jgi:dienelactone hydrolase